MTLSRTGVPLVGHDHPGQIFLVAGGQVIIPPKMGGLLEIGMHLFAELVPPRGGRRRLISQRISVGVLVANGRYCPILLAPAGPTPGRVVTNFRMLVGLWANGYARAVMNLKVRVSNRQGIAAAAPAIPNAFRNFLRSIVSSVSTRHSAQGRFDGL